MLKKQKRKTGILIVKLGAIGDVVMALPMIEAARAKYPECEITWLCGKTVEPILKRINGIDNLVTIDDTKLFTGSIAEKIIEIVKCRKTFFNKKYNLIITPYRDRRYKLLTLFIKNERRLNFEGKDRLNSIIPGRYHANEYAKLILGLEDSEMQNAVFPKLNLEADLTIENIFNDLSAKYIALAPGGAKNLLNEDSLRNWHIDNYKKLAERLIKDNLKVIILGAKSDLWVNKYLGDLDVINLVSKTSMPQLLNVLKRINLLISHDTGILHLGKLFNTVSIGLFGPVNPIERTAENETIKVIWKGNKLPCSPCYNGKYFADCKNNLCMKYISVDEVYDMSQSLLTTNEN